MPADCCTNYHHTTLTATATPIDITETVYIIMPAVGVGLTTVTALDTTPTHLPSALLPVLYVLDVYISLYL